MITPGAVATWPADMIAFGDAILYDLASLKPPGTTGFPPSMFQRGLSSNFNFPEYHKNALKPERLAGQVFESRRHRGLFNVVFCDGHVESLKTNRLFGLSESITQRWNRDNDPHTGAWVAK